MKVGLFVGEIRPTDGGGYVYVAEMLRALSELANRSNHEFVLCHHSGGAAIAREFGAFSSVNLDAERATVQSRKESLLARFPGVVERGFDRIFGTAASMHWDERVYARYGIEFLVRLVPWNAMTLNIPFAAVLWDLQHRNNPWFPEVCGPEWEGREQNFVSLLRRAAAIYTSTQQGKREIEQYYQVPEQRIRVLPFPTPRFALEHADAPVNSEIGTRLSLPKDYLFYPAQFWPHKNHVVILEACKLIRDQTGWDLGVVFVGSDKGNAAYVEAYSRTLGIAAATRILGFVEQADLVQLYKNAFALTYATFCGPDNFPPLEAVALGCPVVASRVPGAEEQLGDAVLMFEPQDERGLAARILELRDPAVRSRQIGAGRVRARRGSWNENAAGIVSSLDEFARIRRAWK
jgi:glycosyltransferase involved in cell wall biosynthesis